MENRQRKRQRLPTQRRVEHALGYIGLGMFAPALAELDSIETGDQFRPEVLSARVELHMTTKQWPEVIAVASRLVQTNPEIEHAWIGWAFALRELDRVAEARTVLLAAEPHHGTTSAVLHYNLACYDSLLGNLTEARRRLAIAYRMDDRLKADGALDPDLRALRAKHT